MTDTLRFFFSKQFFMTLLWYSSLNESPRCGSRYLIIFSRNPFHFQKHMEQEILYNCTRSLRLRLSQFLFSNLNGYFEAHHFYRRKITKQLLTRFLHPLIYHQNLSNCFSGPKAVGRRVCAPEYEGDPSCPSKVSASRKGINKHWRRGNKVGLAGRLLILVET